MIDLASDSDLAKLVEDAWELVDGFSLEEALERFREGLVTTPHEWSPNHETVNRASSTGLDQARVVRLALLALGELPTRDERSFERPLKQPWYRAYVLLEDLLFRTDELFLSLSSSVRWLAIDAMLEAGPHDPRINYEQNASGWLRTAQVKAKEDPRLVEKRLLELAEFSFGCDGYATGSMDFDLGDLANHVEDPKWKCELALRHAYLSYATERWEDHRKQLLIDALSKAESMPEIDIEKVRSECEEIIDSWAAGEPSLPSRARDVPVPPV